MSLPNMSMDFTPFDPLTAAEMDNLVENIEALDTAMGGAWVAYAPVLTASATNPTMGSSTLTGSSTQVGKTVHWKAILTITTGGAWNPGSGTYTISTPSAMKDATDVANGRVTVAGSATYPIMAIYNTPTTFYMIICSNNANVTNLNPVGGAWATGNSIIINGTYEVA